MEKNRGSFTWHSLPDAIFICTCSAILVRFDDTGLVFGPVPGRIVQEAMVPAEGGVAGE